MSAAGRGDPVSVEPVAGALGAEVAGVDLSRPLDNRTASAIHRAFRDHLVLFFRDQELTAEQLMAFSERFGPPMKTPFVAPMPGYPYVVAVLKEADERKISTFGNAWHSDFSSLEEPPLASFLHAREIPAYGGDTIFANMQLAFEALSPAMRRMLEGLKAVHAGKPYGTKYGPPADLRVSRSIGIARNRPEADAEVTHPVVRTIPGTGRKALYLNSIYTLRFEGMSEEESKPLLDFLYAHATQPEFTCRFRWTAKALAMWDNRATLHYAVNDYDGRRRLLYRTMVKGERPV